MLKILINLGITFSYGTQFPQNLLSAPVMNTCRLSNSACLYV